MICWLVIASSSAEPCPTFELAPQQLRTNLQPGCIGEKIIGLCLAGVGIKEFLSDTRQVIHDRVIGSRSYKLEMINRPGSVPSWLRQPATAASTTTSATGAS